MKTIIMIYIGWMGFQSYSFFNLSDYRDSYTGNYVCKEIYRHFTAGYIRQDTLNYTLTVNKGIIDSTLTLITKEGEYNVKLVSGSFKHSGKRCFGKFSGDSIYFMNIPGAGPISYRYAGKK